METPQKNPQYVGLSWLALNFPFARRTWMKWAEAGRLDGAFKTQIGKGPGRWVVPYASALALLKDSPASTTAGDAREDRLPDRGPVLAEA